MQIFDQVKVVAFFDSPESKLSKVFSVFLLSLIYLTVILVIVQERFSDIYLPYKSEFSFVENFILFIFFIELIIRIVFTKDRLGNIFSFYGLIYI